MEIFHSATTSSCNYDKGGDFKSLFFRLLSVIIINWNGYEEFLLADEFTKLYRARHSARWDYRVTYASTALRKTIEFVAYHETLLAFDVIIEE